jgi:molybdopterin-guanine dinucleotide biosynthesis protein A
VLAIPCDSPFLPRNLATRLTEALVPEKAAALASSGGALHPACGLWRARTFFALGSYLATGQRSLRGFAAHVGFAVIGWADGPVDPFFNINTDDDLAYAARLIGS